MSDVFLSIGVAVSAVAALVDSFALLYFAWASGGLAVFLGTAGFASWASGRSGWRNCWET